MKVAIMFAGQGSQYVNMGLEFFKLEKHKIKVEYVNKLLGDNIFDILEDLDKLNNTINTQVLITFMNLLIFDELNITVDGMLGFSLGEYSTLYASGIYDFYQTIDLVYNRSLFMEEALNKNSGKMAAILNYDESLLNELINEVVDFNNFVGIANYNSKKQLVISGDTSSVDSLLTILKNLKVRAVPLNVKGAFHTKYMNSASIKLEKYLTKLNKNSNCIPIYLNVTSNKLNINELEEMLVRQIKEPVLFYQTVENLINEGFTHFIEIGPKNVLTNLVKRDYKVNTYNIENLKQLNELGDFIDG